MDLTVNRDKTRITRLTEGFDFIGFEFVKRRSPTNGKQCIYTQPSKTSQRNIRRQIKSFTKRRAPLQPAEFVKQVNQAVRGWVHYYRHTNASDAFRNLQRFINIRFRRYLNYRSKGRGYGWKKYPNATLYARGLIYIGSGVVEYDREPAHGCEEDCRTAGLGKTERPVGWEGNGGPARRTLVRPCTRGNRQQQIDALYRRRAIPLP